MATGKVIERNGGFTAIYDEPRGPDGKRRQRWKSGFKSKPEAQAYIREQLHKIDRGSYVSPTRIKLAEFLREKWLPSLDVRPSTLDSYVRIIDAHIVPALGRISALEAPAGAHRPLLSRPGGGRALPQVHPQRPRCTPDGARCGGRLGVHRTVAGRAGKASEAQERPGSLAGSGRVVAGRASRVPRLRPRRPTVCGLAVAGDDRAPAREALGLEWSNVDLDTGLITIAKTAVVVNYQVVISEPKTEAGERTLMLDAETVSALRSHRARMAAERLAMGHRWHDTGLVFTTPDGSPIHPQRFSDWFQQRARDAGLPRIRLHDVRHSYITAGLRAGVSMKVMSERAGHSTTAITADLYSHVLREMDAGAADAVAAVIDGVVSASG